MNDEQGYTLNKELIIQAWKRFRPVNKEASKMDGNLGEESPSRSGNFKGRDKPRTKMILIEEIFGKKFTTQLMSEMHLKIYNFSELDEQIKARDEFKTEFSRLYKDKYARMLKADEVENEKNIRNNRKKTDQKPIDETP